MQFSVVAVFLAVGAMAAPSVDPQLVRKDTCSSFSSYGEFPNETTFGQWTLCCNYNGPDPTPSGTYSNCCDVNGAGTGSGFPGCS